MNILFHCFGGINRSAAFFVLGSSSHMATELKRLSAFCSRSELPFDRGDIETTWQCDVAVGTA
jgi:predicted protein tyrosine phosphatase